MSIDGFFFFLVKADRLEPLPPTFVLRLGKVRLDLTHIVSVNVARPGVTHDVSLTLNLLAPTIVGARINS
jgi:hypothetical protein